MRLYIIKGDQPEGLVEDLVKEKINGKGERSLIIDHKPLTLITMLIPGIELSGKPLRDYIPGIRLT